MGSDATTGLPIPGVMHNSLNGQISQFYIALKLFFVWTLLPLTAMAPFDPYSFFQNDFILRHLSLPFGLPPLCRCKAVVSVM